MNKKIVFQNVVFKFVAANKDKYQTNYSFRIYDLDNIEKITQLEATVDEYVKTKQYGDPTHEFNNCFWRGRKEKVHFRVKDKWLELKDFEEGRYYQGNLELSFFSMERKLHFEKGCVIAPVINQEGYFAKLSKIQPFQRDDSE